MKPGSDMPLGAASSLTAQAAAGERVEHAPPRRIGERAEHAVEHGFVILNHTV